MCIDMCIMCVCDACGYQKRVSDALDYRQSWTSRWVLGVYLSPLEDQQCLELLSSLSNPLISPFIFPHRHCVRHVWLLSQIDQIAEVKVSWPVKELKYGNQDPFRVSTQDCQEPILFAPILTPAPWSMKYDVCVYVCLFICLCVYVCMHVIVLLCCQDHKDKQ